MILSDREIQAALRRGSIRITPPPPDIDWAPPEGQKSPWSSTTLDLRLDRPLVQWTVAKTGAKVEFVPPDDPEFDFDGLIAAYAKRFDIPADGHLLAPNQFVLGWTVERISLPSTARLAARVEGKSSLARLGVGVHVTAPTIHAGFGVKTGDAEFVGSPIQLEIYHHGVYPIRLKREMSICQLVFEEVHGTPAKGYEQRGRFAVQGAQPLPPAGPG